jgi:hypothetical protein
MPIPFLATLDEIALVVRSVCEFFLTIAIWDIFLPLAVILIVLEGIQIDSLAAGFIVVDLSFVYAAVIEHVAAFALCDSVAEGTLVVGAVFEEKFSSAMEFVRSPLSMIEPFRSVNFLKGIAEGSFG